MNNTRFKQGFSLLEILLVITLMSILIAMVLTAVNPSRQLAQARDAERLSEIRKISNALDTYAANNRGAYPTGITGWYKDICPVGGGVDCVDLNVLVPTYLDSIPLDPDGMTNYRIGIDPNTNQVSLQAGIVEQEESIAINPLPNVATFAKSGGGTERDVGTGVASYADGSSVAIGFFRETSIFGQGEPNQTSLVGSGGADISIIRYNADGSLAWAKRAGGAGTDRANRIKSYTDGSSIIIGYFSGTAIFGQGEANQTTLVSAGLSDLFIARYNSDGTLAQARRVGGTGHDSAIGIDTFSDGSIVITGGFQNTVTFGQGEPNQTTLVSAGQYDIFTAKYNLDGSLAWARRVGGTGWGEMGYDIVSFSDGSSVVTGNFFGNVTFGQGEPNQTLLISAIPGSLNNQVDIFIAKYNADGSLAWAKRAGGVETEYAYAIDKFSDGSFVITGEFWSVATFGPGESNQTVLTGTFSADMFIAKYNADGSLAWAKKAGSNQAQSDTGFDIVTYPDGNSIVTGTFASGTIFGEGEVNETQVFSNIGSDGIFIAKYNSVGNLIWVKHISKSDGLLYSPSGGYGIAGLSDGSSVVTGSFWENTPFGQGEANEITLTSVGDRDMFIAKYNADGRLE